MFDYADRYPEAVAELAGYLKDGRMKSREDVVEGLDTFPEALLKLFDGENFGKLVLKVGTKTREPAFRPARYHSLSFVDNFPGIGTLLACFDVPENNNMTTTSAQPTADRSWWSPSNSPAAEVSISASGLPIASCPSSRWASTCGLKVRRTRYFYGNTQLAGATFDYHGKPTSILKGRVVAVLLLGGYQIASQSARTLAAVLFLALLIAMPWLIWKSLQFRLYNSSYRGIRFGFAGSPRRLYRLPAVAGAGLLHRLSARAAGSSSHQALSAYAEPLRRRPLSFQRQRRQLLSGLSEGPAGPAGWDHCAGPAFWRLLAAGGKHGAQPGAYRSLLVFLPALYAWFFLMYPLFTAMIQNLVWNHTELGPHRFESCLSWSRIIFIALTNLLAIICTLGLYTPFAKIRMLKYRIESMALLADGSLDNFMSDAQAQASAIGEGMADLLDFDLSL